MKNSIIILILLAAGCSGEAFSEDLFPDEAPSDAAADAERGEGPPTDQDASVDDAGEADAVDAVDAADDQPTDSSGEVGASDAQCAAITPGTCDPAACSCACARNGYARWECATTTDSTGTHAYCSCRGGADD